MHVFLGKFLLSLLLLSEYILFCHCQLVCKYFKIVLIKNCFLRLLFCFVDIVAGECQNISKQYMMVKSDVCMYRKKICNVKSTLQKVLACWATYVENLRLLRACFEETKKEEIKEVFAV